LKPFSAFKSSFGKLHFKVRDSVFASGTSSETSSLCNGSGKVHLSEDEDGHEVGRQSVGPRPKTYSRKKSSASEDSASAKDGGSAAPACAGQLNGRSRADSERSERFPNVLDDEVDRESVSSRLTAAKPISAEAVNDEILGEVEPASKKKGKASSPGGPPTAVKYKSNRNRSHESPFRS
jgi:hypothetical protein